MAYRIFLGILALVAAFVLYQTLSVMWVKHAVHRADPAYVAGERNAELTVVEFLDYSCPRCQKTHPVLLAALEGESVRYIPRPLSTDSEDGRRAAYLAYAAGRQGKFFEAHEAILRDYQPVNDTYIQMLSSRLGLDAERLKNDMNDPAIQRLVAKNAKYNAALGSHTIPTIFINNRLLWIVMGEAPDFRTVQNVLEEAKTQ